MRILELDGTGGTTLFVNRDHIIYFIYHGLTRESEIFLSSGASILVLNGTRNIEKMMNYEG